MLRRKFLMAVAAAAVAGLLGPASARAGFSIEFKTSDGNTQTVSAISPATNIQVGSSATPYGVYDTGGHLLFNVVVNATTDSPGFADISQLVSNTTRINNVSGTSQSLTITVTSSPPDYGFNLPNVAPLVVSNSIAVTNMTGAGSSADLTSTVAGVTTAAAHYDAGGYAPDKTFAYVTPGSYPYTVSNQLSFIVGADGFVNLQGTTSITPAPAPATAILALAGAPIFGVFGWMRRRKAVVA